jgi:hypothetical protein
MIRTMKIGIDLGTKNSLVFIPGKGIVLDEPSVVAVSLEENKILAVGKDAKKMIGRTPDTITVYRPLRDGVIANSRITQAMFKHFISKVNTGFSQGWTAGDNKTKQTAERIENTWQTSIEKGGSPKAPNIKNTQPEKKEEKQEKQTAPLGQASLEEVIQETNFPIKTMLQISFVSSLIAVFIKRQYT